MPNNDVLVFVSYTRPDRDRVTPYVDYLESCGVNVWFDHRRLLPGQNWNFEIRRAVSEADICLVFLSHNSISHRGYVQREIRDILERYQERLPDDIYAIPVVLDPGINVPEGLAAFQWASAERPQHMETILQAIDHQIARLGRARRTLQEVSGITWEVRTREGSRPGTPGTEFNIDVLELSSERYPAARDIANYVNSRWVNQIISSGAHDQGPPPAWWSEAIGGPENEIIHAKCSEPSVVGQVLSITYSVTIMPARGVHPNSHFDTFNFELLEGTLLGDTEGLFADPDIAFPVVQSLARSILRSSGLDSQGVEAGTREWSNFGCIRFKQSGIDFMFGDCAVAAYADGPQVAHVPYEAISHLLTSRVASLLGVDQRS